MKYEMIPCSEDDTEFIEEQADNAFNAIAQPEEDAEEEYVYIVTDESGNLLGGCILSVDGLKTASIYDLWVEEAFRRQGMASALIREAERKAREHGCYLAMVGTFDWQARSFYDKHGYMLNDTMTDVPKGHEHYFLTKRLDCPSAGYMPSNCRQYEIKRGDEKDAEILSGKLHRFDSTIAPREHEYIPLSKKSWTRTEGSLPDLSVVLMVGMAQISMRCGWKENTGIEGSALSSSSSWSGR